MAHREAGRSGVLRKARNYFRVGNFAAARDVLRQGLAAHPHDPELLHLAGRTASSLGEVEAAAVLLQSAAAVSPGVAVFYDLGLACRARGDLIGALNALRDAFKLDPRNGDVARALGDILGQVTTKDYDPRTETLLVGVFEVPGVNYQALAPAVAHQLIRKYGIGEDGSAARELDPADPLLRHYLTKCLNVVPALEYALTRQRRDLLFTAPAALRGTAPAMAALIAFQTFVNEYVFFTGPDEAEAVSGLRERIERALASKEFADDFDADVVRFSMYGPLSSLAGAADCVDRLDANRLADLRDVVRASLRDYLAEQALKPAIRSFSRIEDETSRAVRGQYEENPYPRWIHLPHVAPVELGRLFGSRFPHFASSRLLGHPRRILVAGCGTGRHAANVALQWPGADIVAIDLSLSSIAYATRKMGELGIGNIDFMHGDILEAGRLDGPFDMVQSVGVLHHMEKPVEGWRVLAGLLRPGGTFHVGLYAERARREVVAARQAIAEQGIADDPAGIAGFRRRIFRGEIPGDFSGLIRLADFFSTSTCRDLMFHVHEDTYTPLRLKAEIAAVGLEFVGFNHYAALGLDAAYSARFPDDPSRTDLDNWEALEESLGSLETGYDFWCWKPA